MACGGAAGGAAGLQPIAKSTAALPSIQANRDGRWDVRKISDKCFSLAATNKDRVVAAPVGDYAKWAGIGILSFTTCDQ